MEKQSLLSFQPNQLLYDHGHVKETQSNSTAVLSQNWKRSTYNNLLQHNSHRLFLSSLTQIDQWYARDPHGSLRVFQGQQNEE